MLGNQELSAEDVKILEEKFKKYAALVPGRVEDPPIESLPASPARPVSATVVSDADALRTGLRAVAKNGAGTEKAKRRNYTPEDIAVIRERASARE